MLWDWTYKFEAYTPTPKRQFGYYALPLLWREQVIGWANLSPRDGGLQTEFGHIQRKLRDPAFKTALDDELNLMAQFLTPRD